ncbi:MAG: PIN domain-containing protein [Solirubrobacteraceae bacterium]
MSLLADSSIWAWAAKGSRPDITDKLAERFRRDEIVTCAPVLLEVLHRARSRAEYRHLREALFDPLHWLAIDDRCARRALAVQQAMADTRDGNHRRPGIDYLIAAIAEAAGPDVRLWFFDRDLQVICEHTGQPFEAEAA